MYINSPKWATTREMIIIKRGGRCEVCGTRSNLKLHHARYDNLGREQVADCVVLCNKHHVELHKEHRRAGRPDLYYFSKAFVKNTKSKNLR